MSRRTASLVATLLALAGGTVARANPGAGWTGPLELSNAAFEEAGVPDTVVHVPAGFDPRPPVHVVVLLHGWSCCAASFVGTSPCGPTDPARTGWGIARVHDRARTNTLLLAPQLALLRRDSNPGRFAERGFFRAWLAEALSSPGLSARLGAAIPAHGAASVTLVAHSAGYQAALAILDRGEHDVRNVVLLDALYAGTERFAAWLVAARPDAPRRLVTVHTSLRSTSLQSALLARFVRGRLGGAAVGRPRVDALTASVRAHALVVAETPVGHGEVPGRHLADILRGLGLPERLRE